MKKKHHKGFTLLEALVGIAITSLLVGSIAWILVSTFRANRVIWDQLQSQSDGRRVLATFVNDMHRTNQSSIGAYPIATATTNTLTFYANIDKDQFIERVRYFLVSTTLSRGIIRPSGNPLQYPTSSEQITQVAHDVKNTKQNTPVFLYYNEGYTGIQSPLVSPVSTTAIHMVRVQLQLDRDPLVSPAPFLVQTVVEIRNLKGN